MAEIARHGRLVLHPATAVALQRISQRPAHAVLLTGLPGSGKASVARLLAAQVLEIEPTALDAYPYIARIESEDGKAIPIENIRSLQHFLSLKIPAASRLARIVIVQDAHLMTVEAQNALLKTLEEPPLDTVIIMTATSAESLLATIQSRVRLVRVVPPAASELKIHFSGIGFREADIEKSLMLSGGLPGLWQALLTEPDSHPLYEATVQARTLLQVGAYERLAMVDGLSKQKKLCQDTVFIMGEMASMALRRSGASASPAAARWKQILQATYDASVQLKTNMQPKLVLINLMLAL